MKTARKAVWLLVAALGCATSASAAQITVGGLITPYELYFTAHGTYGGTFVLPGFNPAIEQIDSAVAAFAFSDGYNPDTAREEVDVLLGGLVLIDNQEVDGTHRNVPASYAWYSASLTPAMIADLTPDGSIAYLVQLVNLPNNKDNTWLKGAKLTVQTSLKPPPPYVPPSVPDGGATAALLGLASLGLAWLRRRL